MENTIRSTWSFLEYFQFQISSKQMNEEQKGRVHVHVFSTAVLNQAHVLFDVNMST